MNAQFRDRRAAGRQLANALAAYANSEDAIVIGLPRGGVPVADEIAHALNLSLNVLLVRKISTPDRPELAIGAIAEGGFRVLETAIIEDLHVPDHVVEAASSIARSELGVKVAYFRTILPFPDLRDRIAIVADDGIATGASIRAAIDAIRSFQPRKIVVAAPIGSRTTCDDLLTDADEVICWSTPDEFWAVSQGYEDFEPTTDQEVELLLSPQPESRTSESDM